MNALSNGPGRAGMYTKEPGFISYYEICKKIKNGMSVVQDPIAKAPYGYQNHFWVSYDDQSSLRYKVISLVKSRGLKGVMFWALDLDDFTGSFCGKGKFPLINAAKHELEVPCFGSNAWYGDDKMDRWCAQNCARGNYPNTRCTCDRNWKPNESCHAIGAWKGNSNMDKWCNDSCAIGNCPKNTCKCEH